jgi:4-hydroxybenzoate polyprenyltransferase
VVAVTATSGLLALGAGRGAGTAWVVLAVLAGQLFTGWSNDYLDRGFDRAAGRSDKPLATGEIEPRAVAAAALAALVAAIPLSLASGVAATIVHMVAIASATAYNLGLRATVLSAVPYAVAFGLVPAFVTLGLTPPHWPHAWVIAAAALIGVGGHFAQVRSDVEVDRVHGVLGLPQRVGARASGIAAAAFLVAAATLIAVQGRSVLPLVALAPGVAVAVTPPRLAFRLTLVTAFLTAAAFVWVAGRSA